MRNFIRSQYRFIYKTFLLFVLLVIAYLFIKDNDRNKIKQKILDLVKHPWTLLFLLYLGYLLSCTVVGRYYKNPYGLAFSHFGFRLGDPAWNQDNINNILLFIPFTFLFNQSFKPKTVIKTDLILSFGMTAFIELSQLIGWLGSFQFADMFHNVLGGMIGCALWLICDLVIRRK